MLSPSFDPKHLKRYKDIINLLIKHGQSDMLKVSGLDQAFIDKELNRQASADGDPEQLVHDLEALGPTFIKLGQLLSTRPDFLPQPYLDALGRLQDKVAPFPFSEVEDIVSAEIGLRLSRAFLEFEPEPIAAASLGQVHRARLRNDRLVAVKVQRPGIRQNILEDLEVFNSIAETIDQHTDLGRRYAFRDIIEEFRKALLRELDYRREAQSLITMDENLSSHQHIVVPRPIEDYTTSRVLTMEYIQGVKITELSPLFQLELDGPTLAEALTRAYLDHILVEGFFHADPHPGNIFVTNAGKLALIDLGMVAHVNPTLRENLLRLVLAISGGDAEEVAKRCAKIGVRLDDANHQRLVRQVSHLVARYEDATLEQVAVGRIVLELARLSAENGIRPAPELAIVGKTLLHLDEVGRVLDPKFNPNDVIKQEVNSIMSRHMLQSLSPSNIFSAVLELNEFVQELPPRLNALLDALVTRQFEIKVDALDEVRLTDNLQKIANRITMGLVLAALIVGAALVVQVETPYTIFVYPAIAIILFLVAALFGLALVASIFVNDFFRRK